MIYEMTTTEQAEADLRGIYEVFVIKFDNSETLRVIHIITKYGGTFSTLCIRNGSFQSLCQAVPGKILFRSTIEQLHEK